MKRFLASFLSIVMLLSLMTAPASAALVEGTATLTIVPDKTVLAESDVDQKVVFTISIDGTVERPIGAFSFTLDPKNGMTLSEAIADDKDGAGYWSDASLFYHATISKKGIFTTFEYTPASKYFAASGTTVDRRLTKTATVMTIEATIPANTVGAFTLDVVDDNQFSVGPDGSSTYTRVCATTPVVVVGALPTELAITGVNAPVKGATPVGDSDIASPTNTTATIEWYDGETLLTSNFAASTAYTAKITVTPASGYAFAETTAFKLDGEDLEATDGTGADAGSKIITKTFTATGDKSLTGIAVTGPSEKTYAHGDTLDTAGMVVTATYDDASTDVIDNDDCTIIYDSGENYLTMGENTATVRYGGQNATVSSLNVTAKELTITGLTATGRVYESGNTDVALTGGTLSGKVGTEDVSVTMPTSGTIADADAGDDKAVTVTTPSLEGVDKGNYTLAAISGVTVDISAKALTASDFTMGTNPTYTGSAVSAPVTSSLTSGTDYTVSGTDSLTDVAAADATITFTGDGNYSGTINKAWNLTPVDVTITGATASNKTYDGDDTAVVGGTLEVNGKIGTDDVTVTAGTATFDDQYAGTDKDVTFVDYTLSGAKKDNYKLTAQPASVQADITADADPVVVNDTATVTKGGQTVDLSDNVSGAEGAVSYAVTSGTGTVNAAGVYTSPNTTGTETVKVTVANTDVNGDGTAEYTGTTKPITVTVSEKTTDDDTMTMSASNITYGDTWTDPTVSNQPSGTGAVTYSYVGRDGTSYAADAAPTNAGKYTVTATAESATHIYTATANYEIAQKDVGGATVGAFDAMTYDTTAQTPGATVTTTAGVATGTWSDVTNVTDKTTFTANGNYKGTIEKETGMAKATVTEPTDTTAGTKVYTGAPLTSAISATSDYTVTANAGGTDVGNYDVVVTLVDNANYKWATGADTATRTIQFGITQATTTITGPSITGWNYKAAANAPTATTNFGTVAYAYKVKDAADSTYTAAVPTNAGDYTVQASVAATVNYTAASDTANFTIAKVNYDGSKVASANVMSAGVTGATVDLPELPAGATYGTPADGGGTITASNMSFTDDITLTFDANGKPKDSTGTITIPVTGATNYNDYNVVVTLTSVDKEPASLAVTQSGTTYGSVLADPSYTLASGVNLTSTNYTGDGSYDSTTPPENAGDYTVTVIAESTTHIYTGTANFTIDPKPVTATIDDITAVEYDGTVKEPTLTVKDGTTTIDSSEYTVTYGNNTDAGTATATLNDVAEGNYTVSGSKTFTITPKAVTATIDAITAVTFNGSAQKPSVTAKDGATIIDSSEYTVEYTDNTNAGTATATLKDVADGNYNVSGNANFTINKAAGTAGTAESLVRYDVTTAQSVDISSAIPSKAGTINAISVVETDTSNIIKTGASGDVANKTVSYTLEDSLSFSDQTATLTATVETQNYADFNVVITVKLTNKSTQTISFAESAVDKIYSDVDFTQTADHSVGDGAVTYASGTTSVADVDATTGEITIKDVGSTVITATAAETTDYAQATATYTLTVDKGTITIKVADKSAYKGAVEPTYTYEVTGLRAGEALATEPTVAGVAVHMTTNGTYTIEATGAAAPTGDNYNAIEYEDGTLTVSTKPSSGGGFGGSYTTYYDIAIDVEGKGIVDPDGGSDDVERVKKSADKTFTFTPDEGYEIADVLVNGESVGAVESYKFEKVIKDQTLKVVFEEIEVPSVDTWENPFIDVESDDWFYNGVEYAHKNELMVGITANTFAPVMTTSRGMLMTVLARNAGVDTADGETWYAKGMEWAKEHGVSDGTNPEADLTREQMVTMLWRVAGSPEAKGNLAKFTDADTIGDYAVAAMEWAVENGIVDGTSDTTLSPQRTATRAEFAVILTRFLSK